MTKGLKAGSNQIINSEVRRSDAWHASGVSVDSGGKSLYSGSQERGGKAVDTGDRREGVINTRRKCTQSDFDQ